MRLLPTLLLAPCLLFVSCSPEHTVEDPEDQGLIETDSIGWRELRPAVDDMLQKISQINARGWPSYVKRTEDGKPQIRVHAIMNRTRERFDTVALKNKLQKALINQGVVYVVSEFRDTDAVEAERDHAASGATTEGLDAAEDVTGIVLKGEIIDMVIDQKNAKQHDYQFNLKLIDTRKSRVLAITDTEVRKVLRR